MGLLSNSRNSWRRLQRNIQVAQAGARAFSRALLQPNKLPTPGRTPALYQRFKRPVYALPLDLFRVGFGLVSIAYFWRTFREVADISAPDGFIDHRLARRAFWFTKIGLFHPGLGAHFFRLAHLGGVGASLLLTIGWRVRPVSAYLFTLAVSTFRWNFMAVYVDDAIMHILYFWMMVLPLGRTLSLPQLLSEGRAAVTRWPQEQAPGPAPRLLLANLTLLYLVAGLWKWTSPLWRRGLALYAALKSPASIWPDFWQPKHLPPVVLGNYAALVLEPIFPAMLALPSHHPLKWFLGLGLVGFHSGIIATLRVPFANAACIAAAPIFFREELMGLLGQPPEPELPPGNEPLEPLTKVAAFVVANLVLAMLVDAARPTWRSGPVSAEAGQDNIAISPRHNPFYGILYLLGIAQSYRLFDWVDLRNYFIKYEINRRDEDGRLQPIPWTDFFPQTVRNVLLHSYLHDVNWQAVPRRFLPAVQRSLMSRYAQRYCRLYPNAGRIEINTFRARVTPDNLDLHRYEIAPFMHFACRDGQLDIELMAPTNKNPVGGVVNS